MLTRIPYSARRGFAVAATATLVIACSGKEDSNKTAMADSSAMAMDTSHAAMKMDSAAGGMSTMAMTGNPDQDFLRMMSDHHKGMIMMAHETAEQKDALAVKGDAKKMDREQDVELERMVTMLEKDFKDPYSPKVTPDDKAMVDALTGLKGAAYDSVFRANVIKHHEEAIRMIDEYLPKLTRADLKTMAAQMKAVQTKEIADQMRKLGRT